MKRLMYVIALSAIAVLVFAAIAAAQSVPQGQEPSQNTTDVKSSTINVNGVITVDVRDHAFNPAQLNAAPGTTAKFVNNDTEPHTATADNELFDTGELAPGESFEVYFEGSGTVTYHCELHPDMKGSIVVGEGGGGEETTPPQEASEVESTEPSSGAAQPARGY